MAAFNIAQMRKDGYTDNQIAEALAKQQSVDLARLRKDGYTTDQILGVLNKPVAPASVKPRGTGAPKAAIAPKSYSLLEIPYAVSQNFMKDAASELSKIPAGFAAVVKDPAGAAVGINDALTGVGRFVGDKIGTTKIGDRIEDALTPKGLREQVAKRRAVASDVAKGVQTDYGTYDAFKRTAAERPAKFLMDASTVLTGGGSMVAKAPGVIGKFGRGAVAVGEAVDPVALAAKGVGLTAKGLGVAGQAALALPTSAGFRDVGEAARRGAKGESLDSLRRKYEVEGDPRLAKAPNTETAQRRKAVKKLVKGVSKPGEVMDEIRTMEASGIDPDLVEVLSEASLDRGSAAAARQTPGKKRMITATDMAETQLPENLAARIERDISANPRDVEAVKEDLLGAQSTSAREKYKNPYDQRVPVVGDILSAISGPEGASALRRAEKGASARRDTKLADDIRLLRRELAMQQRAAAGPSPRRGGEFSLDLPYNAGIPRASPTVRAAVLDQVQRALGEMGRNAKSSLVNRKGDIAAGLFGRQGSINKSLDEVEGLAEARADYKSYVDSIAAAEAAEKVLTTESRKKIRTATEGLTPEQLAPGQDVIAERLIAQASAGPSAAQALAKQIALSGEKGLRGRLAQYLPADQVERLAGGSAAELTRLERRQRATPSAGVNRRPLDDMSGAQHALNLAQGAGNLARGKPLSALANFARAPFTSNTIAEEMVGGMLSKARDPENLGVLNEVWRPARTALDAAYGAGRLAKPLAAGFDAVSKEYKYIRPALSALRAGQPSLEDLTTKYEGLPTQADEAPVQEEPQVDAQAEEITPEQAEIEAKLVMAESNNDPNAVSPVGAIGRWQVMPATLDDPGFGIEPAKDRSDEEVSRVGQAYFRALLAKHDGFLVPTLAAYNWGPGKADRWIEQGADFNALPAETQAYIKRILGDDLGL